MKRIKELIPGALDNFNAYYDTNYRNGEFLVFWLVSFVLLEVRDIKKLKE
ncbi:hypothetical protein [Leuconostoc kimchii]|nr:hypothetical protein [Leuconostoc kimchii]